MNPKRQLYISVTEEMYQRILKETKRMRLAKPTATVRWIIQKYFYDEDFYLGGSRKSQ